ncbi:MAG: hypothetical protein CVU62_04555 [Deltaproteobacteria bacterium HGW-Deltaproteobacteria-2]|jgi:hypothetical protein|nr:MAG: hypothetical protein CVU62_04555 [Deltaproteobacteria bacterium HGW-Deltaproteobacteria-2]
MKRKIILIICVLSLVILTIAYLSINKNEQPLSERPLVDEPSMGGKNAKDQNEACSVASFIRKEYVATGTDQDIIKMYCKGGSRSFHIHIYGITKHGSQDIIVKLVESELHKRSWKPVYLLFLERENFIKSWGAGYERANEKKLYSVLIK